MNSLVLAFDLKNRAIIFNKISFNKITDKLHKIKLYNYECYSKLEAISGYLRGQIHFGTLEFHFVEFIHIEHIIKQFIKFINDGESFGVKYDELEHFLEFLDFLIMDPYPLFIKKIYAVLYVILYNDFNEFVCYCNTPLINTIITNKNQNIYTYVKEKIIRENKCCDIDQFHKFIDLNNQEDEINFLCSCEIKVKDFKYCYFRECFIEATDNNKFKKSKNPDVLTNYNEIIKTPRLLKLIQNNSYYKFSIIEIKN